MQMNHSERIDYLKKLFDSKLSKDWVQLRQQNAGPVQSLETDPLPYTALYSQV